MSDEIQIAVISLASAILGVLLTQGLQWWRERADKKFVDGKNRQKTGAFIAHQLDEFSVDCAMQMYTNRWAENSDGMLYDGELNIPELRILPENIDRSTLAPEQYSKLLALETHHRVGNFQIGQAHYLSSGDVGIEETKRQIRRVSNVARKLASEIRKSLDLPIPKYDDENLSVTGELSEPEKEAS